ncbi:MAG: phosphonate ABC transporter ATP-binding protein [Rhodospirillaceae bacterium]|nr:phosphonate ABC transporter ATP-binding protein [Rhodospirillaceae bacterium]MBT6119635.1 phosphonate ABC transporter ATP-binding protein [Rhodospirillaceae bacterium]
MTIPDCRAGPTRETEVSLPNTTAIAIRGLTKSFGRERAALDDVSLDIEQGEMVALIGASGSGKSTLIRLISGLLRADRRAGAAAVTVHGRPVQTGGRLASNAQAVRGDIGVIFQQFNLVGRLSLLTNVLIGALGHVPTWRGTLGLFGREEKRRAMEALARVGMHERAAQRASTLSGGQQQRGAIARALLQRAKVILADEPIASLDPASATRVMEALSEINRDDGITVLVSLHQVDYAIRYCPRAIALRDGRVVYDGPSTAIDRAFLEELYGADNEELIVGEDRPTAATGGERTLAAVGG